MYRKHYAADVTETLDGQTVQVAGWVHRRRDHGGVIFIDLRDRSGLVQIVIDPDTADAFALAEQVRNEYCLAIEGRVRLRPAGTENPDLASGKIEILGKQLTVLSKSEPLPFQLDEDNVSEEIRLKHRTIDLRRDVMQKNLILRSKVAASLRRYLDEHGFMDIETPMLTKATPEGARDYLVPSRTHPGKFFALPQSPQLFKQMLMMSGFDRYYQIVRCFRDEDLRADRQPEFTQLDIETSFLEEEDILQIMEPMIRGIFKEHLGVELANPFPRMAYREAMRRYASDKPDLRIPLELVDIDDLVKNSGFKVFTSVAAQDNGRVVALKIPGGAKLTRKEIDDYTAYVARYGAKGLAYIKVNDATNVEGLQSPIVKFLTTEGGAEGAIALDIIKRVDAQNGDPAHQSWPRPQHAHLRLGAAVGGGLPDVRIRRKRRPLVLHAPPLHPAENREPRRTGHQPRRRPLARLRHGAERYRNRRRLHPHPPRRHATARLQKPRHRRRRSPRKIRLPAERTKIRLPAAWRHRLWP